ncbi:Myeloid zinc finger 1 [Trichinella zimbabwensis]|uniref:Myeloid zinc finger 1 n=1 Tax=Trichinella zimbabwensis TaxID=268475 RepID=A0A0V1HP12_9BILA|nr:Myeloid zinc finger 1 [Trichinella zimbabwensis]
MGETLREYIAELHRLSRHCNFCNVGEMLIDRLSCGRKMETFTCDICQAEFLRRSSLFNHRNVHDQNPKHACSLCGAAFRWKASLKSHLKSHARKRKTEETFKPFDHQNFFDDHCQNIDAQEQEPSENGSGTEKLEAVVNVEEVIFDQSNSAEVRNADAFYNEINVSSEKTFAEVLVVDDYEIVTKNEKTYTVMKNMDVSKNNASTQLYLHYLRMMENKKNGHFNVSLKINNAWLFGMI